MFTRTTTNISVVTVCACLCECVCALNAGVWTAGALSSGFQAVQPKVKGQRLKNLACAQGL